MSRPGGLQLSPIQIVASLLATLTGAVLASYLGVGGTLTGAAVGSIASTTGTEVYRHYLRRSQERLKAAGEVLRNRQEASGQHARHAAGQRAGPARLGDAATETQMLPAPASAWQRRMGGEPASLSAGDRASGEFSNGAAADGGGSGGPWWRDISRRQWLTYGGVALGVFLVGMVIVTIIELSAGKPLDAAVWGKHSTGTSVGTMLGGRSNQQPSPHTSTPGTQPGSSTAPSSPTATPSGTAPSPSTPASSVPSSGPAATPTPGSGQGSAQAVTPTP